MPKGKPWTEHERRQFEAGAALHGNKWTRIAHGIPTRTAKQVIDYGTYFIKLRRDDAEQIRERQNAQRRKNYASAENAAYRDKRNQWRREMYATDDAFRNKKCQLSKEYYREVQVPKRQAATLVLAKKVTNSLLRTLNGVVEKFSPTYYFEMNEVLVSNPDYVSQLNSSSISTDVHPLKRSFETVKFQPFAAVSHCTLYQTSKFETGVNGLRVSKAFADLEENTKDEIHHNHHQHGEPTYVYGHSYIKGCPPFAAGHWPPAFHLHFIDSPTIELPDGTEKKRFTVELLLWFPWMLDLFYCFHQIVLANDNVCPSVYQLTKCADENGAGAVLQLTFLLSMNWKDVEPHHFYLDEAVEKRWLHLDGDLEKELVGSDGGKGYEFDDERVVTDSFGIMSRNHREKLEQEGFYEVDDAVDDEDEVELNELNDRKPAAAAKSAAELNDRKPAAKSARAALVTVARDDVVELESDDDEVEFVGVCCDLTNEVDDRKPAAKSARATVVTMARAPKKPKKSTKSKKQTKKTKAHELGQQLVRDGKAKPLTSFFLHRK